MEHVTSLIVSLSGLSERNLPACVEFATELDSRLVPASWLLPPRPRDGRHLPDAPVIGWLRGRIGAGDALVLHGFDHSVTPGGRALLGRRAEFAALPSHEATLRLIAATRTMDDLGLHSDVFAPPRWLASAGTIVALRRRGFRVCADGSGVRLLDRHAARDRMLRGRVLSTGGALTASGVLGNGVLGNAVLGGGVRGGMLGSGMLGSGLLGTGGALETGGSRGTGGVLGTGSGRGSGTALGSAGVPPETTEAWRHRSLVASAARLARRGGLVRIAADAAELSRPAARQALLDAVDAALAAGARPATYRSPVPRPAPLSA
ncbi:MAG: deacetylase [Pseudonocardia sp.]|nr:deacetylase [Pseudonocardia sp.]